MQTFSSPSTTGLPAPQLARITQLHGLLVGSNCLRGDEPKLEGLTPTQDLNLFREAQEMTKESLVSVYSVCVCVRVPGVIQWNP